MQDQTFSLTTFTVELSPFKFTESKRKKWLLLGDSEVLPQIQYFSFNAQISIDSASTTSARDSDLLEQQSRFIKFSNCLCPNDPLSRFLEIHQDVDLTTLNLHPDSVQEIRDNTDWEDFFAPGNVYQHISRRKNGNAAVSHGMQNELLKVLQQDPAFLLLFIKGILCGIAQGLEPFFSFLFFCVLC
jgi:hypothetical protein